MSSLEVFGNVFVGPLFTWSNNQGETFQARKLNRVLENFSWCDAFLYSFVKFIACGVLDHCSAMVNFLK